MTLHLTSCRHADVDEIGVAQLAADFEHVYRVHAQWPHSPVRVEMNRSALRLCADALRRVCGEEKG